MSRLREDFLPVCPARRGSVVVIVLWTIAVAAILTSSIQLFSYRQATVGREALERAQARWAARGGLEYTLAVMTQHTQRPYPNDAKALAQHMYYICRGSLVNADYDIRHHVDGADLGGPMDEHSKININVPDQVGMLMLLDGMTLDIVDAVADWIDEDDEPRLLGVERDYYLSLRPPYVPRNGPLRSIGEFELIGGVWPKYARGEDWNINAVRDPNEDDGNRSLPPDEPDGVLDPGWLGRLTVYSVAGGATESGSPRICLRKATAEELVDRLKVNEAQAKSLLAFGTNQQNRLADLLLASASSGQQQNNNQSGRSGRSGQQGQNRQNQQPQGGAPAFSDAELRVILAETCMEDPLDRQPGKMNINTVPSNLLHDIIQAANLDDSIADELLYMRESRAQGISSLVDLKTIPNITSEALRTLTRLFDVSSSVFTVTSRGRSSATGVEVEIIAVVDRSTVPVRIIEYREQ